MKNIIKKIKYNKHHNNNFESIIKSPKKKIILMGSPEYNNLGDHAIAYATEFFIKDNISDVEYFEIPEKEILYNIKNLKKIINKEDILLLQGGGNMGDIYPDQVKIRKKIIKEFKDNEIIIMPQTIYFAKKTSRLPYYYYKHQNLTIFTREKVSYEIVKNMYYKDRVYLVPDIVMYLIGKLKLEKNYTTKVLVCIRNDKESKSNTYQKKVEEVLKDNNIIYENISTVIDKNIILKERKKYLMNLFEKFSNSRLIITDRLHGMIIAAITKTPCIVLPTFNHKVLWSYEWLKDLNYIQLIKNFEELNEFINYYNNLFEINADDINLKYNDIIKVINKGD